MINSVVYPRLRITLVQHLMQKILTTCGANSRTFVAQVLLTELWLLASMLEGAWLPCMDAKPTSAMSMSRELDADNPYAVLTYN